MVSRELGSRRYYVAKRQRLNPPNDLAIDGHDTLGSSTGGSLDEVSLFPQSNASTGSGSADRNERRMPYPYPASRFIWDRERPLASIPAVDAILTGGKTLSPQRIGAVMQRNLNLLRRKLRQRMNGR